jgi:DNA-directed RNA polymerase specialized sigma24 family protein
MSLDELLRAVKNDEPGAEQRLFRRLRLELLPFFKKRVEASDVEDLTQETMTIVVAKLRAKPFEPTGPSSFRSFVFVIASFCLKSDRKAKRRDHRDPPPLPAGWWDEPESRPDEATMILQQTALLHTALTTIKTVYRRALESRLRDEDPRVFADAEGIELGTLRCRISRAWALVRAEIQARRRTARVMSPTG